MSRPTGKKRVPTWLRNLGWLGVLLLGLVMILLTALRLVENSHQKAQALAKPGRTLQKSASKNAVAAASAPEGSAADSRGTPLAELPLIGIHAGDDAAARQELGKQMEEIRELMRSSYGCRVNGVLGFRAMLARMGMAVPETMTEAEAAAEFLRRMERFSTTLAQWQEAIGKGPWNAGGLESKDSYATGNKMFTLAVSLQQLMGTMAEARLRKGDTDGAWSDLKTMNVAADRMGEALVSPVFWLWPQMFQTAHAGMMLGEWTDAQLMEIPRLLGEKNSIASMRGEMDREQFRITGYLTHFQENQSRIQEDFSRSKSPVDKMFNRIGIATATDQQISDNLAVIHFQMDQPFNRFDPVSGIYLGEQAADSGGLPHSKPSDVSFDKFYYMYSEMYGGRHDWVAEQIIRSQSSIDQTRIAAALEMQHRKTGEYPATLDAVSGTFGGSTPVDIATGQPYFYQRDAEGGYTLWGAGIDQKNDGGDENSDVTWKHRPMKGR
ncbi:MAG: hypothetical protein V4584_04050 [Verrucomicrobiota bacterium]